MYPAAEEINWPGISENFIQKDKEMKRLEEILKWYKDSEKATVSREKEKFSKWRKFYLKGDLISWLKRQKYQKG